MAWAERAGQLGTDVLVCPELATTGYVWRDRAALLPHAEPAEGPTFAALAEVARAHGMWIVCGYPERAGDLLYNAALVISHTGTLVDSYRKVLLFREDLHWSEPGDHRLLCTTPFGTLATGICMDLNDPGFTRFLARRQPDVVAFCTNWVDQGERVEWYWRERLAGVRGLFVAADSWGDDEGIRFYGRSGVLRGGRTLLQLGPNGDGLIYGSEGNFTSTATSSSSDTSGAR